VSQLGAFFNGTDTRLGVFYPDHSLIAIFQNLGQADAAKLSLRGVGFSDDEVLAASGADLADLVHEESLANGPLGYLIKALSRFLHTEAVYTDHDLMCAKRGAAVLAVHCPDERTKKVAWSLIAPTDPVTARYYGLGGIEHLAGET
jgi:hypothetical protein